MDTLSTTQEEPSKARLCTHPKSTHLRKRDRAATEERLLAAAEDIFSRFGFQAATTKLISQQSGVNESLIARYFNGKSGLLFAILEKRIDDSLNKELTYAPQATVESELEKYVEFAVDRYRDETGILKIVVTQTLTDEDFNRRFRDIVPTVINKELARRMDSLVREGKVLRAEDTCRILDGLGVHIFGYILMRVVMLGEEMDRAAEALRLHALDCARLLTSPA